MNEPLQTTAVIKTYNAEFAGGFTARMTIGPGGMLVEWSPHTPKLTGERLAAYRVWRNECLADYSRVIGGGVVVVEL